ncbi:AMP-binding protein [Thermoproteota archaeon]
MMKKTKNTWQTLVDLLRYRAGAHPDRKAYIFLADQEGREEIMTYGGLDHRARAVAADLQALNLEGKTALLLYPPGLDFIHAFFGCLYAGVIAVPGYPPHANRSAVRIERMAQYSQSAIVLCTQEVKERVMSKGFASAYLNKLNWYPTDNAQSQSAEAHYNILQSSDARPDEVYSENSHHSVQPWRTPDINSGTIAMLQYTSGSTSEPKGVIIRHSSILYNQLMMKHSLHHDENTVVVGWSPHFHDQGLIGNLLHPLFLGSTCIFMAPMAFIEKPVRWLRAITKYKARTTGAPNFAYDLCVQKIKPEEKAGLDLSSLRVAYNGAEPIRLSTLTNFTNAFKDCGFRFCMFYPVYGLAEGMLFSSGGRYDQEPVILALDANAFKKNDLVEGESALEDNNQACGTFNKFLVGCGKTSLDQVIKIVDAQTLKELPPMQIGEIWIHGPNIAAGYWNKPEQTKAVFQARLEDDDREYLRTGDLGFFRHNRELFITGRLKDLIIIHGQNHYPQDIEYSVEAADDAVQKNSITAFSIDSDEQEKLVVVAEIKREYIKKLNTENVFHSIVQAVSEAHAIDVYEIVLIKPMHIPKTSSGKLQRALCRQKYLENRLETIAVWKGQSRNKPLNTTMNLEKKMNYKPLIKICNEIFNLPIPIGPFDDFQAWAVNSLKSAQLLACLEQEYAISIRLEELLGMRTIAEVYDYIIEKKLNSSCQLIKSPDIQTAPNIKPINNGNESTAPHFQGVPTQFNHVAMEPRPLLNLITSGALAPVDSATLAYLPKSLFQNDIKGSEMFMAHTQGLPFVFTVLTAEIGRMGVIILPIDESELYLNKQKLNDLVTQGLLTAKRIGAGTVSFAGVLASAMNYGLDALPAAQDIGVQITTGHATTTASILILLERVCQLMDRQLSDLSIGIAGLGSIGTAVLRTCLQSLPHPKSLLLCDIPQKGSHVLELKQKISGQFKNEIKVLLSGAHLPDHIYDADIIIGASNIGNILEIEKLKPGTVIIDDSYPHCFDTQKAFYRFNTQADILMSEGGMLNAPSPLTELRYADEAILNIKEKIPGSFWTRTSREITSCILSSLMSQKYSDAPHTLGFLDAQVCLQHIARLRKLGYQSGDLRLDGRSLSRQNINTFVDGIKSRIQV